MEKIVRIMLSFGYCNQKYSIKITDVLKNQFLENTMFAEHWQKWEK